MLSSSVSDKVIPDYKASTWHVYRDALLAHIDVTEGANILGHCDISHHGEDSPSWVPNWAVAPASLLWYPQAFREASGYSTVSAEYHSADVLEALGIECRRITEVCKVPPPRSGEPYLDFLRSEPAGDLDSDYVGGGDLLDAFLEVISNGRTRDRYIGSSRYPSIEELRTGYRDVTSKGGSIDKFLGPAAAVLNSGGETYIKAIGGYLGITSAKAKQGKQGPAP